MTRIEKKSLNQPEDLQTPEKTKIETITIDGHKIQRVTAEPGWKWSEHIKPIAGGESCQKHHLLYIISGRMFAQMNDEKAVEFGPGDVAVIPPGHDGWNAGNEPVVWIEIPH
jgi:mannose-6-phosphate isomerase-like protein (cupin superfamily)